MFYKRRSINLMFVIVKHIFSNFLHIKLIYKTENLFKSILKQYDKWFVILQ